MSFGQKLLEFRARNNLTQKDVADILGVKKNVIWRYENGVSHPNAMHCIRYTNKMKEWEDKKNV